MLSSNSPGTQGPSTVLLCHLQYVTSKVTGLLCVKQVESKRIQEGHRKEVFMDLEFSHMATSTYKGREEMQRKRVCAALGSGPSQRQLGLESSFLKFC